MGEILALVVPALPAIIKGIAAAIKAGNVSALEELAKVCPDAEVIALRDEALVRAQHAKAEAELGGSST